MYIYVYILCKSMYTYIMHIYMYDICISSTSAKVILGNNSGVTIGSMWFHGVVIQPNICSTVLFSLVGRRFQHKHTLDGRNPAPVYMVSILYTVYPNN